MTEKIILNIELTRNDVKALHRCHRAQNKKWTDSYVFIGTAGVLFMAASVHLFNVDKPFWSIAAGALGVILLMNPYLEERQVLKQECPKLTLTLGDEVVEIRNEDKGSYEGHKWSGFAGWVETVSHFFLFLPHNRAIILPKKSTKPTELITHAIALVKSKTKPFKAIKNRDFKSNTLPIFIWVILFLIIFFILHLTGNGAKS